MKLDQMMETSTSQFKHPFFILELRQFLYNFNAPPSAHGEIGHGHRTMVYEKYKL
jgi:hypothetical protein